MKLVKLVLGVIDPMQKVVYRDIKGSSDHRNGWVAELTFHKKSESIFLFSGLTQKVPQRPMQKNPEEIDTNYILVENMTHREL